VRRRETLLPWNQRSSSLKLLRLDKTSHLPTFRGNQTCCLIQHRSITSKHQPSEATKHAVYCNIALLPLNKVHTTHEIHSLKTPQIVSDVGKGSNCKRTGLLSEMWITESGLIKSDNGCDVKSLHCGVLGSVTFRHETMNRWAGGGGYNFASSLYEELH
jgi:hypothetical protein